MRSPRVVRKNRYRSYEEHASAFNPLVVPSIGRCRHVWLTNVLVQFYQSIPLERVDLSNAKVGKAALGGKFGLDYFVHLYFKKFEKTVPVNVQVNELEVSSSEIVLTQHALRDWWQQKLYIGLRGWPGFYMDAEHVDCLTARSVFYAKLQMTTWRQMQVFVTSIPTP